MTATYKSIGSKLSNADHDLMDGVDLLKERHEKYCRRLLAVLPSAFASMESVRMTVVFFAISALDVIGSLDSVMTPERKEEAIEWIYTLQVTSAKDAAAFRCGFRGSNCVRVAQSLNDVDGGHLAMTYTALATLTILGDDLSRVDAESITKGMRELQQDDGGFIASVQAPEKDMRFLYCACAVCYFLNDWSGMDVDAAVDYISKSISYDGGIGQGPFLESHGGSTYCALASLSLMGRLDQVLNGPRWDKVLQWCLFRLHQGFQGRPNKPDDTCYTFWIGASLRILCRDVRDIEMLRTISTRSHKFVLNTQDSIVGGFSKWPLETMPDPIHTYLGLSGMSLFTDTDAGGDEGASLGVNELRTVNAQLNITQRAVEHLKSIHDCALKIKNANSL